MLSALRTSSLALVVLAICFVVVLFSWRRYVRGTLAPLSAHDVIAEMQVRATQAVDSAARDFKFTLDFTPESVRNVETILSQLHVQHSQSPFAEDQLTKHALKWGGYVGEVIKKTKPSEWVLDSAIGGPGSLPVVYADKGESFPVRWCYKRIVNGEEDNVWHKFSALVINRDKLPPLPTGDHVDSKDVRTAK